MQLFDWQLTADQSSKWYGAGRYLRLVECTGTIIIEVEYEAPENDRISSKLIRGIGVDLSHPLSGARVKSINFVSPISQTLSVLVSELPTTDSRLAGSVTVGAGGAILTTADTNILNAASANVAGNLSRRAITVYCLAANTGALRVAEAGAAGAARGVEVMPGTSWRFESTAALQIYNGSGSTQAYMIVEES